MPKAINRNHPHNFKWWILGLCSFGICSILVNSGILEGVDLWLWDRGWRALHPKYNTNNIVLVGIDESDIATYGWPISDDKLATLLQKIDSQEPAVIGLDIYRNVPVAPGTKKLNAFFQQSNRIIGIEKVLGKGEKIPPNPTLKKRRRTASSDIPEDPDGKIRRGFLYPNAQDDPSLPSLPVALAFSYLETQGILPQSGEGGWLQLGRHTFKKLASTDGGYRSIDAGSYQTFIDYSGSPGSFPTISISQVLNDTAPPNAFNGKIVIVGALAPSLKDAHLTPYPGRMSGIEIQANLTNQIVEIAVNKRQGIGFISDIAELGILFIISLSFSYYCFRYRRLTLEILGFSVALLLTVALSATLQVRSIWLPITSNLITICIIFTTSLYFKQIEQIERHNRDLKRLNQELALKQRNLENLAALGRLVAAVSHEIKNPLGFIISLAEITADEPVLDAEHRERIALIARYGYRIQDIVDRILQFSRPQSLELSLVNLSELVEESLLCAWQGFKQEYPQAEASFATDVPENIELVTSSTYLQLVLINIIKNALEASSHSSGRETEIQIKCTEQRDETTIRIEDNGSGIASSDIARIFEPFFTTKGAATGTGLGLWISDRIIDSLGGKILVDSRQGEWTRFTIILPNQVKN